MEEKLLHLKESMDKSIFLKKRFTEKKKHMIFEAMKNKEQRKGTHRKLNKSLKYGSLAFALITTIFFGMALFNSSRFEHSITNDQTVQLPTVNISNKNIQPVEFGFTGSFPSCYRTLKDVYNASDYIVRCKIDKVEFISINGMPLTKMDVKITEPLKGTFHTNDKISVVQLGGYLPLADEIKYFNNSKSHFSSLTDEQIANTIIEKKLYGQPFPKAGEEWVYFINKAPEQAPAGTFVFPGDFMSRYKLTDYSNLERFSPDPDYYTIYDPTSHTVIRKGDKKYTYEEMKREILSFNSK